MDSVVNGMHVAILVADGFEQSHLTEARKVLEAEGAFTRIVSNKFDPIQALHNGEPGEEFTVDLLLREADAKAFDAVLLPGGEGSAAALRELEEAKCFVQNIQEDNKAIAVLGHGVWILISADLVEGRLLTSSPALEQDIRNAKGNWTDQATVADGNLVSVRDEAGIPAFNEKMIEAISNRMRKNLRGKAEEHAVGLASS